MRIHESVRRAGGTRGEGWPNSVRIVDQPSGRLNHLPPRQTTAASVAETSRRCRSTGRLGRAVLLWMRRLGRAVLLWMRRLGRAVLLWMRRLGRAVLLWMRRLGRAMLRWTRRLGRAELRRVDSGIARGGASAARRGVNRRPACPPPCRRAPLPPWRCRPREQPNRRTSGERPARPVRVAAPVATRRWD